MKRKIALVVCLIMIATMVMTVLVACGGNKMDLFLNKVDSIGESTNLSKKKELIVTLSELGGFYGEHTFTVSSNKTLKSVELQCTQTNGAKWSTIATYKNVTKITEKRFNMNAYYNCDVHGDPIDVKCYGYRLRIVNGSKKAKVNINFARYFDFKEISINKGKDYTTSYYWKPTKDRIADTVEIAAYETVSHLFLSVAQAKKLGNILQNAKFNNAIKELTKFEKKDEEKRYNEYKEMFLDALKEANKALASSEDLESARQSVISTLFAELLSKLGGVALFKSQLKKLAKTLNAAKVPQLVIFQRACNDQMGDTYKLISEPIPSYKNSNGVTTYYLIGAACYVGGFKSY